jgi:AbrB family looped-hinge helix DNA binding protein
MVAVVMSTVRVREKRQITIPSDVGIKAGIEPNDILEVGV